MKVTVVYWHYRKVWRRTRDNNEGNCRLMALEKYRELSTNSLLQLLRRAYLFSFFWVAFSKQIPTIYKAMLHKFYGFHHRLISRFNFIFYMWSMLIFSVVSVASFFCFFFIFVLCRMPNVACVSRSSNIEYPFGFLKQLLTSIAQVSPVEPHRIAT